MLLTLDSLGYIALAECIGVSSTNVTYWALKATEFAEIPQYNGHYAIQIQGNRFSYQSKAHICGFLLVINTNLPPILHRFQVMADY